MALIKKIYDLLAWYPWMSCLLKDYMSENLKERLPLQKPKDRPLSILLNGPSLKKSLQYLERDKTDVCMVNYAVSTELYEQMKPEFICLADPVFFIMNRKIYNYYKRIKEVNPEQIIYYPSYAKINSLKKEKLQFKRVYTTDSLYDVDKYSLTLLEKNLMAPFFINVAILALYVGIQLGYKKIYLHGADINDFKNLVINEDLRVEILDSHYYGDRMLVLEGNMDMLMRCTQKEFSQFYILKQYANAKNVKIINMSNESMLDCFERFKFYNGGNTNVYK